MFTAHIFSLCKVWRHHCWNVQHARYAVGSYAVGVNGNLYNTSDCATDLDQYFHSLFSKYEF